MAFLGFRQPSAVADQDAAIADREAAWNSLRRDIDPSMMALNFGLNLMANSETQGLGSAIGNAGMDALKTHNAIMQARQAQANAMQAREDKLQQHRDQLAQNEIANTLARDRLNWDIEHGRNQDRYAEATLNSTLQKNQLDAYRAMQEMERVNMIRQRKGLPPIAMPSIPGLTAGAGSGRTAAPAAPFVARQDENGAWVLPGSRSADDIKNLLANGTVAGMDPKIAELIEAEAIRQGVNPTLAKAVAMQESSGNHQRYLTPNEAGAVGLMQVIPGDAHEYGMKPEDAFDLNGNIRYGIAELKKKLALNGGDINAALLGYNWGQGNVDAYRKTGKSRKGKDMSKEAYEYADRVLGRITPGKQPAVQPEVPATPAAQLTAPATPTAQAPAQAPVMVYGKEATPEWVQQQLDDIELDYDGKYGLKARAEANLKEYDTQRKLQQEGGQYVDGVGMVNKKTGVVTPLKNDQGETIKTPKEQKEEEAAANQKALTTKTAGIQLSAIDDAINLIEKGGLGGGFGVTGYSGSILSLLSNTDARRLLNKLDTIKGGSLVEMLMGMKSASSNGSSGFGALDKSEGKALVDALGSLDTWQGDASLVDNLRQIRALYSDALKRAGISEEDIRNGRGEGGGNDTLPPGFVEVKKK